MNRTIDPVVECAREILEPLFERLGFAVASDWVSPEAFGSVSTEYRRRSHRLELVWDGKDRWLWIKVAETGSNKMPVPGGWQDLEGSLRLVPEGRALQPGPAAEARAQQLASAVMQFFHRDPAI